MAARRTAAPPSAAVDGDDTYAVVKVYERFLEATIYPVLDGAVRRVNTFAARVQVTSFAAAERTRQFIFTLIATTIVFFVLLSTSVCMYALFYYIFVPVVAHVKPVYFQFDPAYEQYPHAVVDFTDNVQRRFLYANQAYDVSVQMQVPDSLRNQEAGMFMVRVDLQNTQNQTVHSSSRPFTLNYQSNIVKTLTTLTFSVPLVLGWTSEAHTLRMPLMEHIYDDAVYGNAITKAYLQLSKPQLEIYSAEVRIDARFSGLRYMMYSWFFTTAIVGISSILFWQFVIVIFGWAYIASRAPPIPAAVPLPADAFAMPRPAEPLVPPGDRMAAVERVGRERVERPVTATSTILPAASLSSSSTLPSVSSSRLRPATGGSSSNVPAAFGAASAAASSSTVNEFAATSAAAAPASASTLAPASAQTVYGAGVADVGGEAAASSSSSRLTQASAATGSSNTTSTRRRSSVARQLKGLVREMRTSAHSQEVPRGFITRDTVRRRPRTGGVLEDEESSSEDISMSDQQEGGRTSRSRRRADRGDKLREDDHDERSSENEDDADDDESENDDGGNSMGEDEPGMEDAVGDERDAEVPS